ncbi:HPr family phosphocarrier protein [Paenibacillus thiaminolyticus]|uniref:HPr family phosphocarrier protein n=1 Tax=Paenibacillus thiaminolyticus TaxID=49283 RepID=UPI001164E813|nr:HPr family phosphocarrier protein [Paenibacillus thiaminolyticus]MDG0874795.1 HPr family phosphocarrier protein [Paenibacillus thiaminolyticus]NGP57398.1 HPr family phosphocarrier protein [Paenibacillus thiaminolyticus]WCR27411.1 HPr family phosphocarrier protein [Paenibacillus thiaminolyticus]
MDKQVTIVNPLGIHSRPAGALMKQAKAFPCDIRLLKGEKAVNAKSIVGILSLSLQQGDQVIVEAKGEQEAEAVEALTAVLESILEA